MEKTLPNILAFLCTVFNCEIYAEYSTEFKKHKHSLLSSYVIRFGIYFLMLNWPLYSKKLRRIFYICEFLYRLIVCIFIYEMLMVHVWFTIETLIFDLIQLTCIVIDYELFGKPYLTARLNYAGFLPPGLNYYLLTLSLVISLIILCCILQQTCFVNFGLIFRGEGISVFTYDTCNNIKKGLSKMVDVDSDVSIPLRKHTRHFCR